MLSDKLLLQGELKFGMRTVIRPQSGFTPSAAHRKTFGWKLLLYLQMEFPKDAWYEESNLKI